VYHVFLFFHVRPVNQPTTTGVALFRAKFERLCLRFFVGQSSVRVERTKWFYDYSVGPVFFIIQRNEHLSQ
jgi:hypothetical protein